LNCLEELIEESRRGSYSWWGGERMNKGQRHKGWREVGEFDKHFVGILELDMGRWEGETR
jgi:hypothetical protein